MTLNDLQKQHGNSEYAFVEITDKEDAMNQIRSKTACCWGSGGKIAPGWIQLCSPAKQRKNDIRTVFVCRESLLK